MHAPAATVHRFDTGVASLDIVCGGIGPGDLILVAGPPMSGKTTLALTLARHVCETYDRHALYWGPHIREDRCFADACNTLSAMTRGALHLQCMNEDLEMTTLPPGKLSVLIADDIQYQLAVRDPLWNKGPEELMPMLRWLKRIARRHHLAVLAILELGPNGYPDGRLSCDPPRLTDLRLLAGAVQRIGKILVMHRPALYTTGSDVRWRLAEVEVPPQCARAGSSHGSALIILDSDSALYRELTDGEWRSLFSAWHPNVGDSGAST